MLRKKTKKKIRKPSLWNATTRRDSTSAEHDFTGPNVRKRHRKPDEIYGDVSIPDGARKE